MSSRPKGDTLVSKDAKLGVMFAFLGKFTPRSYNAPKKPAYKASLVAAFKQYHASVAPLTGELYAKIYYFHRLNTGLDADNLSKPVWDALKAVAYADDGQIRWRSAGLFDLQRLGIEVLDLSRMPDYLFTDFIKLLDQAVDHIMYVEIGPINYDLFIFG